ISPREAAPGEAALMTRLAPDATAARAWAEAAQDLTARARQGRAVNLDPASLILDTVLRLDETAGRLAA
ncbi:DNA polymerase III subunit delta', partial [Rhodovulum visakhapatnamense]|nr:DNA polymerase III subunit delta' [Rhodovulum visakhapatnamense]